MDLKAIGDSALGALIPLAAGGFGVWAWGKFVRPWKTAASYDKILERLDSMDNGREAARKYHAEEIQTTHRLIGCIMTGQDAMLDALKSAGIGNGNCEKARKALADAQGIQNGYLIEQLKG